MFNRGELAPCPACGAAVRVDVFPALFRPLAPGQAGERLMVEGESSCFYHPQKRAVVPCDNCGRFLCALCDLELNDQHLCPACLEAGSKKGRIASLQHQRMCYDRLALWLAVLPLFIWPFTLVTAPMALFFAIRHWNSPSSILGGNKVRLVAAMVVAVLQLAGWTLLFYAMARS